MSAVRTTDAQRGRVGRIAGVAGAAIAAAALTAGCAAGQVAQTADQRPSLDGTNASVGAIDLRAVAIESPPNLQPTYRAGSAGLLNIVLINNGRTADRLVDVRGSVVRGWGVYQTAADAYNVVLAAAGSGASSSPSAAVSSSESATGSVPTDSATNSPAGSESESGSTSASSSASSSASTSASGSASTSASGSASGSASESASGSASAPSSAASGATSTPTPRGVQSVTIPAGGRVGFGTPEAVGGIVLTGITKTLRPAQTVNISFTFARAGTVTVPVSVQVADLGRTASVAGGGDEG